ncbi:PAS domain S-box protein [Arcobacter arenosus]|jgi:PAS domain S-box-containing protein|uniref:histidine kinase n=1 Tax=Arcobacter arenosus TaxID=2576037 RepID=A0A5R8Y0D4_9BACT|nr:PAS domain S-box protein [Arcobacter arenosus]TLP38331.1 PAS domain S-box protein [Arcobacter arenosus]
MAYFLITLASFLFAYLAFRYEKLVIRNNAILEHYNEELESELKKRTAQLNKQKKQLEESEFRWKFAVDGRGDGLWDWNVDTNEVYFSKAWKEMLGFKEDEIQGSLEEWKKRVHPDDLEKVYEDINSHMNGETEVYSNEHRVMCKDGSYKWVHDRGIVVQRNEKGRPTRLIGTHTDITLRKETEFKMQQALIVYENTNEGIMITNSKNEIIDVNHSFCKTTGYSYEEVIGKNPSILKSNIKESDFYRQMWQELKDNGSWHGEITNKKKNGELYEEYLNINTIKNNDGTVINYIGIFSDVSVLKQQEKMILQQARTSAIGEMIGNIAHQWRQPLSAISTASTGLKVQLEMDMEISKEETIESLEKINSQTQFLSRTIEDFRGFFSEDMSEVFEFEITEAINKVNDLTKDSFKINFVQVYYDIEKEVFILANKNLLIQALINIYNNALDVLKEIEGKRLLFISVKKNDFNTTLSIKDNGGGISSSNIEKIFDPYFTTKHQSQGTGIGLYMSHQIIVKQLKGNILAKNVKYEHDGEEFMGALFTIIIPTK